ncbi:MAG: hypothetical protein NC917_07015 [Candidatus Omnitrophica bacterium]|nr:hypothetical protein [Candidatus Omnitrophota bacterium]MCM8811374.1 hypothetical protein [Candidatus Omnitrophota bacterium]
MSRKIALDAINLKMEKRVAHTEYSMEYHIEYITKITDLKEGHPERIKKFYEIWEYDFLWRTNDGIFGNWLERGRATDMGHAIYAKDGSDMREKKVCPFKDVFEVWEFDPAKEYGFPDFKEQVFEYQKIYQGLSETFPEQLITGGYYKTIISGLIQAFGWEMLLLAASNLNKFEKLIDRFFNYTLFYMRAWSKTDVEVIIQHDDFVWYSGPFISPDFYRKAIIPRYGELWKELKKNNKKILFCSDGNFSMFAKDIVEAGADGLIFEPVNDFGFMVENFGEDICLIGSYVDCRDMTMGKFEKVKNDIDKTLSYVKKGKCKGLIFAVGNHIPANISDEMCEKYINYLKEKLIL